MNRFPRQIRCRLNAAAVLLLALGVLAFANPAYGASVTDGALRFKLENGLTVILKEDHSAPVAALQLWVKTGSANEQEQEAGITHFIEHLIFKGTPKRKTGEIARTIEASGGEINAYTSFDRTVYYVEISSDRFTTALEVLLDAVLHALFDPMEVQREREVVLEEYRRSLDLPRTRLTWEMMRLRYQVHPYGRPIIGLESTIRSFDRPMVAHYVEKWYGPENMVLSAVGDFDADSAIEMIRKLAVEFPGKGLTRAARPREPEQKALRRLSLKDRVQQVYLDLSWPIPELSHEDIPALDLLEILLGHGRTSRLYSRLKMDSNLAHEIGASSYSLADPGLFSISGTLDAKNLLPVLKAIAREVGEISSVPVSEEEVEKAKTLAEADFLYDMETMSGQAGTLAFFEMMRGDMSLAKTYLDALKAVTPEDVRHAARTYLKPERLSVGVLQPDDADEPPSRRQLTDIFSSPSLKATLANEEDVFRRIQKGHALAQRTILQNGLRVVIEPNPRLPVVSMVAVLLGGTRLERPAESGTSGFVAKMLTRGTTTRNALEIASTVENLAGRLEGFSGRNSLGLKAKFLAKDVFTGLDLIADLLLHSVFPEGEVEKVRADMLAAIKAKMDRPAAQAFDLFYETLYRKHPYRHPQTGTAETVAALTSGDLKTWYDRLMASDNLVLTIVGDVDEARVIEQVESLFSGLRPREKGIAAVDPEPPITEVREARLERQSAQTHLIMGFLGASLHSNNNLPMSIVETALSGQGGRLFYHLRDRQSLAYALSSFRHPGLETGAFAIYLACDPSKVSAARRAILEQLEDLRREGLSRKEFLDAKQYLLGTMRVDLQTNSSRAMRMALDELYGLGYDYWQRFIQEIGSVTPEDIQRAVLEILRPETAVFVTVGP